MCNACWDGQSKKAFLAGQVSVPEEVDEHQYWSESKPWIGTRHTDSVDYRVPTSVTHQLIVESVVLPPEKSSGIIKGVALP